MSLPEGKDEEKVSRRRLLRSAIIFGAVSAAILIGVDTLAKQTPSSASAGGSASKASPPSSPAATSAPPVAPSNDTSSASGSPLKVKVMYFQMPLTIGTKEEYFTLQSPAYLRDLLRCVEEEHPPISPMIPTMMILIDGVIGLPGTTLQDGDEVDFIPAIAGG